MIVTEKELVDVLESQDFEYGILNNKNHVEKYVMDFYRDKLIFVIEYDVSETVKIDTDKVETYFVIKTPFSKKRVNFEETSKFSEHLDDLPSFLEEIVSKEKNALLLKRIYKKMNKRAIEELQCFDSIKTKECKDLVTAIRKYAKATIKSLGNVKE